uniref:Uncharacterized protein n=1 Tax=Arundo donax TaxID=35708 RepID=A0A0A9HAS6_ARUDO
MIHGITDTPCNIRFTTESVTLSLETYVLGKNQIK